MWILKKRIIPFSNQLLILFQPEMPKKRLSHYKELSMDDVFGKNMEAFPESEDEDESCDRDGAIEYVDSGEGSDDSSNNGGDVSATVIDRGYT
jgi:hypothetical protein